MECKIRVVDSVSKFDEELHKDLDKIKTPMTGIVMNPKTFGKVFSPERIKLLRRIYKNNIKNIYQLAKDLEKPYEVVFRNIKYLEGIGLIKIKDKDNTKIPYAEKITLDLFAMV